MDNASQYEHLIDAQQTESPNDCKNNSSLESQSKYETLSLK